MIKIFWLSLVFAGGALFATSCSSIKKRAFSVYLRSFQDKKANKIRFLPPPSPYERQSHPALDALWWNPQSGSSISYFSSCSKVQKTLEEFQKTAFPQSSQYKLLKKLQSKKSLYSVLEMPHAHQKTYSGIYTIKKGQCYFNINLVADSYPSFEKEEPVFKTFIKSFHPQ